MRFVPYDPSFDPVSLDPFEALKADFHDGTGLVLTGGEIANGALENERITDSLVLRVCSDDEAQRAVAKLQPRRLMLSAVRMSDLTSIGCLKDLEVLALIDMPRLETLSPLVYHKKLEALLIEDCSRLTEVGAIGFLVRLILLRLSGPALGGGWKKVDLASLANLSRLRYLSLRGLRTPDERLLTIAALPALETLQLDGGWPARELARVAAHQPHLVGKSTFLKPLVASADTQSGGFFDVDPNAYSKDILSFMASGKRGAYGLRPGKDDKKISRIIADWEKWVDEFTTDESVHRPV